MENGPRKNEWTVCWPTDWNDLPSQKPKPPPTEKPPVVERPVPSEQGNTGCYTGGLPFADLLGEDSTDYSHVEADIKTTCKMAEGKVIEFGRAWKHCSKWTKPDGGSSHINWEIQHDYDGTDDRTVSYDDCVNAWNTELGGCSTGSEQKHNGLWMKIDPNDGSCPS